MPDLSCMGAGLRAEIRDGSRRRTVMFGLGVFRPDPRARPDGLAPMSRP
jgi:hypothetical protein